MASGRTMVGGCQAAACACATRHVNFLLGCMQHVQFEASENNLLILELFFITVFTIRVCSYSLAECCLFSFTLSYKQESTGYIII